MTTGGHSPGARRDGASLCPDGHHVPEGVRFCPACGRYVGPSLDEASWPPEGADRPAPRRRPSRWPGRILAAIGLGAFAVFVVALVRMGPGGTEEVTEPPATTSSGTVPSATTLPPVDGQPCAATGVRDGAFWCEPTDAGPIWRPTPYAGASDVVGLVGRWPAGTAVPSDALVRIAGVATAAGNPADRTDGDSPLWCVAVILQNRDTTTLVYGADQYRLLDPAGNLVPAAQVAGLEPPPLGRGELLPGGTVASYVCFPVSNAGPGRYAVVYRPPGSLGRALLYIDR